MAVEHQPVSPDTQWSPEYFLTRLFFVRLSNGVFWPCLRCDSYHQCQQVCRQRGILSLEGGNKVSRALILHNMRTRKMNLKPSEILLLLGQETPNDQRVLLPDPTLELKPFEETVVEVMARFCDNQHLVDAIVGLERFMEEAYNSPTTDAPATILVSPMSLATKDNKATEIENAASAGAMTTAKAPPTTEKSTAVVAGTVESTETVAVKAPATLPTEPAKEVVEQMEMSETVQCAEMATDSAAMEEDPHEGKTDEMQINSQERSTGGKSEEKKTPDEEAQKLVLPSKQTSVSSDNPNPQMDVEQRLENSTQVTQDEAMDVEENEAYMTPLGKDSSSGSRKGSLTKSTNASSKKKERKLLCTIQVVHFSEIKKHLAKAGFVFRKNLFCRPGKDPRKNENAVKGEDFFDNEKDFRKHLCAYGLENYANWSDEARDAIDKWVRYSILELDGSHREIPVYVREKKALRELMTAKIVGYKRGHLGEIYSIDNRQFRSENDLLNHLIRFGFPETCTFNQLDVSFRSGLVEEMIELFKWRRGDTFIFIDPKEVAEEEASAFNDSSSGERSSRSARKRKNRQNIEQRVKTPKRTKTASPSSSDSFATARSEETPVARRVSMTPANKLPSPPEPPTYSGTDSERLQACLDALKPSDDRFLPNLGLNSQFTENVTKVNNFLESLVESDERGVKPSASALYVCGEPGIGKTSAVKWCCEQLQQRTDAVVVSCTTASQMNGSKGTDTPMENLATKLGLKKYTENSILNKMKKTRVVVVLDEIDLAIKNTDADVTTSNMTKKEKLIKKLLGWAQNDSYKFAFIAIANAKIGSQYARLQQLGTFDHTVDFATYTVDELEFILKARVGLSVVHSMALSFIVKKVATKNGDARMLFQVASNAILHCLDKVPSETHSTSGPLVMIGDVSQSIKASGEEGPDFRKLVDGLPPAGQVALCIVAIFADSNIENLTIGMLQDAVGDCLASTNRATNMLEGGDFISTLNIIKDHRLVSFELAKNASVYESCSAPITFSSTLQEVQAALDKELKAEFFTKVRQNAKEYLRQLKSYL